MPAVLSIGVFDAVHLGHQALLAAARAVAHRRRADLVVLAFDPHPYAVLAPDTLPPRILGPSDKQRFLLEHGADRVELLAPTGELLTQSPAEFVERVLRRFDPVAVVEGPDFRFGRARQGDPDTLRALGIEAVVLEKTQVTLCDLMRTTVSSSLIRYLLAQGRVADAQRCLGRPFALTSTVVTGDRRGRELGFPTVNLDLNLIADFIRPAPGVYAGAAVLADGSTHAAAISVGDKPTFDRAGELTVEAHLLNFRGDLYGQTVTLRFTRWLRDQLPFPSVDALAAQMRRDLDATRELAAVA